MAVCVIAIFLDILYGNLLYVIHCDPEEEEKRRQKKNLCVYTPIQQIVWEWIKYALVVAFFLMCGVLSAAKYFEYIRLFTTKV